MNIRDLEEFEGLSSAMVRAYLERTGWKLRKCSVYYEWFHDGSLIRAIYDRSSSLHKDGADAHQMDPRSAIDAICDHEKRSPQAILREMNPRLIKGCPNPELRAAHKGHWIAISPSGAGYLVKFDERSGDPGFEVYRSSARGADDDPFRDPGCSYNVSDFRGGLAHWSFWPCDAAGNKVPLNKVKPCQ